MHADSLTANALQRRSRQRRHNNQSYFLVCCCEQGDTFVQSHIQGLNILSFQFVLTICI